MPATPSDSTVPSPSGAARSTRTLLEGQRLVLEQVVAGRPLPPVLASLCRLVETEAPRQVMSAVLLVDRETNCLRIGAAPSLPPAFAEVMECAPLAEGHGTCPTAAVHARACVSTDVTRDPEWRHVPDPARLGFAASWSEPVIGSSGEVIGTFGCYFPEHRGPLPEERELVGVLARTAALALERHREDVRARDAARRDRFIATLGAATQPLTDADAIMATTARMLAEFLDADRCAYANIENGDFVITGDHPRGLPSIVGRWQIAAFGVACERSLQAGKAFVVDDVENDPRIVGAERDVYRQAGIRAVISMPLLKDGVFTAGTGVHQKSPRAWTPEEVELVRDVTARCWDSLERTRLQREIEDSEARYRAMIEANPECVKVVAPDGTLLQMNEAGLRMVEAPHPDAALGHCVYDLIAPEHRDAFQALNEQVCAGANGELAFEIVGLEGTRRWMETTAVPMPWPGGGIAQLAVTRDVTRRIHAERSQQNDRARLDYAVQLSGIGFWYCDLPFDELIWDERVREHFWLSKDVRVTIELFYQQIHPEDREPTRLAIEASIVGRTSYDVLYRTVDAASGAIKWIRALGGTAYAADGTPIRFDGVTVDVTTHKRDQENLARLLEGEREQARLLAQVAQAARTIYASGSVESLLRVVTSEARRIVGAHQAVTSLTTDGGWSQAIVDVSLSDKYAAYRHYTAPPNGKGIYSLVCERNQPMRMTQAEMEAHPRWSGLSGEGGRHPPLRGWLAVPLIGHDGHNLGVLQLSDRLEGEFTETDEAVLMQLAQLAAVALENARLYDRLREQDRRKDEFLATLAHELRNPLAPIRTGLHVLGMMQLPPQAERVQVMMDRQLGHMVRLVDDLLDVSRITLGKITLARVRTPVAGIIESAVEATRALIESRGHVLELVVPDSSVAVDADATRLSQVLANLLNNAARYTPKGGRIVLEAVRDEAHVLIRVRDTGIGIPADMQSRIFDAFTQVDRSLERSQGGLGIGLTLVRRLVELHGGAVEVESAGEGLGSTFTVRLPVSTSTYDAGGPAPSGDVQSRARRVLVVDDNVDAAEALHIALRMAGHEVALAHDGLEALQRVADFAPEVVLLDIGLPGMSGFDVARRIREETPAPQPMIIALTGWGSDEDRRHAREAGFDGHLVKPVGPGDVEAAMAAGPAR